MARLLDAFPGQALDFYGAMRASVYDTQIRQWIEDDIVEGKLTAEESNLAELSRRLVTK